MSKILIPLGVGVFLLVVGVPKVIASFNEYDMTAGWIVAAAWIIAGAGALAVLFAVFALAVRVGSGSEKTAT